MPQAKTVFLRDIARALEKALMANTETNLHWVAVVNEDSVTPQPLRKWEFDDHLIQVSIANGFSEGSLIYVLAQPDRYKPDQLIALFRVKVLCNTQKAFGEGGAIFSFFESKEFAQITGTA